MIRTVQINTNKIEIVSTSFLVCKTKELIVYFKTY